MDEFTAKLLKQRALIGGQWVNSTDRLEVTNPATGRALGSVPSLGSREIEKAIEVAHSAFGGWSRLAAYERGRLLMAWYDLILANLEELAFILTLEQGKPIAEAADEVRYGASFVHWFASEGIRSYGEIIPPAQPHSRILVEKQPLGVCAAITPWNFPNAMVTRKVAPALAAGCTIVVKPSELTPYSALALGKLALEAGIPPGVLNIVTGNPVEIGRILTSSPVVRKLSFTGSTRVGELLFGASASTMKRLSLELGGNAPFIIFPDADLNLAVEGVLANKFRNAGQTCVCANRIFVHDEIYSAFAELLATRVADLKIGNGLEADVSIGPLINSDSVRKVLEHVENAVNNGGELLVGSAEAKQNFFAPAVIINASDDMRVFEEETFGPVAPLFRFSGLEDVIRRANGTPFGLAAYVYTQDLNQGLAVTRDLQFGMVGLNTGSVSFAAAPFGGVKSSDVGREGSHHGLDEYLDLKSIHIGNLLAT